MEESPYAPNSIPPALVVFGGSSYPDPIRMQRERPFASQVSDGKQLNLSNLSAQGFGLRPMESYGGLPAQLVHLQNPFLHPALDARLPFGTAGAFRPVVTQSSSVGGSSAGGGAAGDEQQRRDVKSLPSAFTPPTASRGGRKFDEGGGTTGISPGGTAAGFGGGQQPLSSGGQSSGLLNLEKSYVNGGGRHRSLSPPSVSKEERGEQDLPSMERVEERSGSPNSDVEDRSSPEEPHLPLKRRRGVGGSVGSGEVGCPVCKMSVRGVELESHLLSEVEQLMCMSRLGRTSQSLAVQRAQDDACTSAQDSPSAAQASQQKKESAAEVSQDSRWETYHRVRSNRHSRLRLKTRRRREESGGPHVNCPVCQMPLHGSNEQLSQHVETCLRKNGDMLDEDEPVDIEGDGEGPDTEDYEWMAERRARPLANISPNYPHAGAVTALNMTTGSRRRERDRDLDENDSLEVVVDGDDSSTYGHAQYTESDIQSTLLQASTSDPRPYSPFHGAHPAPSTHDCKGAGWDSDEAGDGGDDGGGQSQSQVNQAMLLKALKGRIRELEKQVKVGLAQDGHQCLICMDKYKKPVVSISCWHVHCEECWLRTLGAKKLCPQCNMITSAADLRRIFL